MFQPNRFQLVFPLVALLSLPALSLARAETVAEKLKSYPKGFQKACKPDGDGKLTDIKETKVDLPSVAVSLVSCNQSVEEGGKTISDPVAMAAFLGKRVLWMMKGSSFGHWVVKPKNSYLAVRGRDWEGYPRLVLIGDAPKPKVVGHWRIMFKSDDEALATSGADRFCDVKVEGNAIVATYTMGKIKPVKKSPVRVTFKTVDGDSPACK